MPHIPVVTVILNYTESHPTPEMERRISPYSDPSIDANVNGIKNMRSTTLDGCLSIQKIYFQPDINLDLAIAQYISAGGFHSRPDVTHITAANHRADSMRRTTPRSCSSVSIRTI